MPRVSRACTTSTTTPTRRWCQAWSSTGTTRRCASPTPRTSGSGRWRAVDASPTPVEWFVLNAEANVEVDLTAIDALDELRAELERRGIVFALARVKQDLRDDLAAAGLVERVGDDHIFPTLPTAVQGYVDWYTNRHGTPPAGISGTPAAPDQRQPETSPPPGS